MSVPIIAPDAPRQPPAQDELAFLDSVLVSLRKRKTKLILRMSDARLDAIRREVPGRHFSEYPYLY